MALTVAIDGFPVGGLLHANFTTNNYFSSDSFSLTFTFGRPPLADLDWWAKLVTPYVEVSYFEVAFPAPITIITGVVDLLIVDPIHNIVSIEGRDLSACLIDSYVQQDFVNQTASEIIESIASQYGLLAQATATSGNVGRYFGDGYTKLSLGQFSSLRSNWDLAVELARQANFDLFVEGNLLVFQPTARTLLPMTAMTPADVTTMRVEKTLAIDASVSVKVQSWNSQKMTSYSSTTSDSGMASQAGSDSPTVPGASTYLFSKSNLTPVQTDLSAQQFTNEISRLRTVLHVDMPWDFRFSTRSLIALRGTGSVMDGCYQVDSLERRFSSTSGSSQTIRAVIWQPPD